MTTTRAVVARADLAGVLAPRQGVVAERRVERAWPAPEATSRARPAPEATSRARPAPEATSRAEGDVCFEQAEGPLRSYERRVHLGAEVDGRTEVTQRVSLSVGLPGFGWLFAIPLRFYTARIGPVRRSPWWAPPARLPRRAAVVLATLCLLTVVVGYLTDLLADTMTYAGSEFRVGRSGQGLALGVVEAGAVGALVALQVADRRGRRQVLLWTLAASAAVSALAAAAPTLVVLTGFELVAGALVGADFVIIGVMAVEEMPAGSRAWAVGVIGMCFGLGSGLTLLALPLADVGRGGWRGPYAIALLGVPAVAACARWLPETGRWAYPPPAGRSSASRPAGQRRLSPTVRRRLLILGAGGFLLAVFTSPASQFQNEFLHVQRHLSATKISLLEQLSGTIGGLGTLVGGRLADTWGRRPVAAIGVAAGTAVTIAHYASSGVGLWVWNTLGSVISYGVGPALAVYGAELFPTALRARAGGVLTVVAAGGGVLGLVGGGAASAAFGSTAAALSLLAVAPALVVVLILVAYPETAGVSLETLNPDRLLTEGRSPVAAPSGRL